MSRRKGKKLAPFVALDRQMLKSAEWRTGLTSSEKIVYIHLKYKFVGWNNGDIELHYSELRDFLAPGTIWRAFKGLQAKGWIERTKYGGLRRFVNKYRLTGKHDHDRNIYRQLQVMNRDVTYLG